MKKALYVLGGVVVALLMVPGVSTAADTFKNVFITNDASHPVPTQAQGTTQVGGSVAVSGSVDVNNPVDVRTGPEARAPYQHTTFFNQTETTCTQFVCTVDFPQVPDGKRLVVTYVSAQYALTTDGFGASVRLSDGSSFLDGSSITLPAPVHIGIRTWLASGPVTYDVEAGRSPRLELQGQFVQPVSNTAEVSIAGYLVPAS